MHGYDVIQELSARTSGVWQPSPGSVYPTLQMLEEQGLVTSQDAEGKRLYTLTEAGRAEVERQASSNAPWQQMVDDTDPVAVALRDAATSLLGAARQVQLVGTQAQKEQATQLLAETRRRLYALLGEEQPPPSAGTNQ